MASPKEARNLAIEIAAVAQWEVAKGHLRAVVALMGSMMADYNASTPSRYEKLDKAVEDFITLVEDDDLHQPEPN